MRTSKTLETGLFSFSNRILDCFSPNFYPMTSFDNFRDRVKSERRLCRASIQDQNLRLQYKALHRANCVIIYDDKASGARASRDGLKLALDVLQENGGLVVWGLVRLGGSVKDLVKNVCDLT